MKSLTFEVFGRRVLVIAEDQGWQAFYQGNEGKRRPAADIIIPPTLTEAEIEQYLADLCHEWATDRYPDVKRLD